MEGLFSRVLTTGAGGSEVQGLIDTEDGQRAVLEVIERHPRRDFRLLGCLSLKDALERGVRASDEMKAVLLRSIASEKQQEVRNALVPLLSGVWGQLEGNWPEFNQLFEVCVRNGELGIAVSMGLSLARHEAARESKEFGALCEQVVMKAVAEGRAEEVSGALALANMTGVRLGGDAIVGTLLRVLPSAGQQTCFDICHEMAKSVRNGEEGEVVRAFEGVLKLCVCEELEVESRRASLLVVNAIVMRATETLFRVLPVIAEAALKLCDECFDEFCATDNAAAGVNFKFVRYFAKANAEAFWNGIKEVFHVTSPGRVFGLLLAVQQAQKWYRGDINVLLNLLKQALATKIHSIQEQALSVLYDMMVYHEYALREESEAVFGMISGSVSDHRALGEVCMDCLIRVLFFGICDKSLCGPAAALILHCLREGHGIVQSLASVAVSAMAHEFKDLAAPCVAEALPFMWKQATERKHGDYVSQPRAIEALCVCLRFTPAPCEALKPQIIEATVKAIHSDDRQMFVSACWAIKNLSKARVPDMVRYVGPISGCVARALMTPIEMKESIDDSGVSATEVVKAALDLSIAGLRHIGAYIGLDISNALCAFDDRSEIWGCKEESIIALKTVGYFCPSYLPVVLPRIMAREEVWDYLRALVMGAENVDLTVLQMISRISVEAVKAGNFNAMCAVVALVKKKGFSYSVEKVLAVIEEYKDRMTHSGLAEFVEIFDALCHAGNFEEKESWQQAIKKCLDSLPLCSSFTFKPTPIKFLGTLVEEGFQFDNQSLINFMQCFCGIMHQPGEGIFYEQTMTEILNTGIIIMLQHPELDIDWHGFLCALLPLLPPGDTSDSSRLYENLMKIRTTKVFTEHQDLHQLLFSVLVRTLAGTEDHICEISINATLEAALVRHLVEYIKINPKLYEQVGVILDGDADRLMRLKERCADLQLGT